MKSATLQCYTVLAWRFANRLISKDFFAAKNRWRREWDSDLHFDNSKCLDDFGSYRATKELAKFSPD
jgi:hypothetical protein